MDTAGGREKGKCHRLQPRHRLGQKHQAILHHRMGLCLPRQNKLRAEYSEDFWAVAIKNKAFTLKTEELGL